MAITFSMDYKNTPEDFQRRMYAQLQAQSIAIAAALALAAKNDGHKNAIDHALLRTQEVDKTDSILPIDQRDRRFAQQHLNDIFAEAQKLLDINLPWDRKSEE